jgi:cobalt-precorrin-5B (C1)-methyltransferase
LKKVVRTGITTGTAATAAAVGAVLKLLGRNVETVDVVLPDGTYVEIPLKQEQRFTVCRKWTVEEEDVTNNLEFFVEAMHLKERKIEIIGLDGIGLVTKNGLQIPVGEKAINPVPKRMIESNISPLLDHFGVRIMINIPDGVKIAKKTFNERLGIVDGISIIGTKGIINPMSEDALIKTILCEIDVKINYGVVALAPGNIGEKALLKYGIENVVLVNNYFNVALQHLKAKKSTKVILGGHPGKLGKLALGIFYTHSKNTGLMVKEIAKVAGIDGEYNTMEEICQVCELSTLAFYISEKVKSMFGFKYVDTYLFSMSGKLVGRYIDE